MRFIPILFFLTSIFGALFAVALPTHNPNSVRASDGKIKYGPPHSWIRLQLIKLIKQESRGFASCSPSRGTRPRFRHLRGSWAETTCQDCIQRWSKETPRQPRFARQGSQESKELAQEYRQEWNEKERCQFSEDCVSKPEMLLSQSWCWRFANTRHLAHTQGSKDPKLHITANLWNGKNKLKNTHNKGNLHHLYVGNRRVSKTYQGAVTRAGKKM